MTDEIKREKESKKEGKTLNSQGKTFYEAVPATAVAPRVWHLPKTKLQSVAAFLENVLWFFLGTGEVLLFARTLLIWAGAKGENMLSFAIYALSYPFVYAINPEATQITARTGQVVPETISIMFVYFIIAYVFFKLLQALELSEEDLD